MDYYFTLYVSCFLDVNLQGGSHERSGPGGSGSGGSRGTRVVRQSHTAASSGMVPSAVHNVFDNGLLACFKRSFCFYFVSTKYA